MERKEFSHPRMVVNAVEGDNKPRHRTRCEAAEGKFYVHGREVAGLVKSRLISKFRGSFSTSEMLT